MHELTLVKNVIEMALQVSHEHAKRRVTGVHLRIGMLRQVVPEFLEFAFEAAAAGTLAEGARLTWTLLPLRVHCRSCEADFDAEGLQWRCTCCGAAGGRIVQGDELVVESIELAEEADERDEHED